MTEETKIIKLPADGELALRLKEAARTREPVVVQTGEERYTLVVDRASGDTERLAPEEIERSREGIRRAFGGWKDIDTEAFKAYIAERRRAANRPSVRL